MGADLMRHYTKAEWGKIPESYKGRWEASPYNLERVKQGELPAEYIGKRNTMSMTSITARCLSPRARTS